MPIGPYETFNECVLAQRKDGKDELSARKICGEMEEEQQQQQQKEAAASSTRSKNNTSRDVARYEENGRLYIRAFLLDSSVNINEWGISPRSLNANVGTFIGKPLVLTSDFNHPRPPEETLSEKDRDSYYYDNDNDPRNVINVNDIVDHWLAYQEAYRVGSIIDITQKNNAYYAIIEVTDDAAKEAFRNNDVPLFVSPALAQLDPYEDPANITQWTGIHLAIVSEPAYTIKKALVTNQCHGDGDKCLLQLRQASIRKNKSLGCGFCRTKALQRYASIIIHNNNNNNNNKNVNWTKNYDDFLNSSVLTSRPQYAVVEQNLTDNQQNNNSNNQKNNNNNNNNKTSDTDKEQDFERVQNEQGGDLAEQPQKGNPPNNSSPSPKETTTTEEENEKKTTVTKEAADLGIKVAGMEECIQIFTQNGVAPDQSAEICKLAAEALMKNQENTPSSNSSGNGPGIGGQYGSTTRVGAGGLTEYDKLLAKKDITIEKLADELKQYKKNDKSDAQRIAELEDQLGNLQLVLKEKEISEYLATKIEDPDQRTAKVKKFATLNLSINDIKEIYDDTFVSTVNNNNNKTNVKKTASVIEQQQQSQSTNNNNNNTNPIAKAIGKAKLLTASVEQEDQLNSENDNSSSKIRAANNRIVSSLLQKGGIY